MMSKCRALEAYGRVEFQAQEVEDGDRLKGGQDGDCKYDANR